MVEARLCLCRAQILRQHLPAETDGTGSNVWILGEYNRLAVILKPSIYPTVDVSQFCYFILSHRQQICQKLSRKRQSAISIMIVTSTGKLPAPVNLHANLAWPKWAVDVVLKVKMWDLEMELSWLLPPGAMIRVKGGALSKTTSLPCANGKSSAACQPWSEHSGQPF